MNVHVSVQPSQVADFEVVETSVRLAEIGPAWDVLWHEIDGLIFQSHAWVEAWWSTSPDRARRALRIGLAWQGDRLVAVVPLAIARRSGLRVLEWAAASYTDYPDILCHEACAPEALTGIWRALKRSGGFDLVLLNRLLPGASARALSGASRAAGLRLAANHRQETSFRVAGPFTTGQAWFDAQSKKTRQNYRRGLKQLEDAGAVAFRLVPPGESLEPILHRLSQFKRQWLEKRGQHAELFDDGGATLPALIDVLQSRGLLRVFVLECAGELVAVSLNFAQRNTMMAFITTYDPAFERASPGMVLMIDYIRWSIDNGLSLVDFLCGAEPFKLRFANQSEVLGTLVAAASLLGHLALLADKGRDALRQLRSVQREPGVAEDAPDT